MKQCVKRFTALFLTLVMVLMLLPTTAMASIGDLLGNSPQTNQELLQRLTEMVGDEATAEELCAYLQEKNLLDEDGNLSLTESVTVDGVEMSVAELRAMLDDPSTDLSKTVDVDGTTITLEDLDTMLKIEEQLAQVKALLLGSGPSTPEGIAQANASLQSIADQIEEEGIGLHAEDAGLPLRIDHNVYLEVGFQEVNAQDDGKGGNPNGEILPDFTLDGWNGGEVHVLVVGRLVDKDGTPLEKAPQDIRCGVRIVPGSMRTTGGTHDRDFSVLRTDWNELRWTKGGSNFATAYDGNAPVVIGVYDSDLTNSAASPEAAQGYKVVTAQFYDVQNALFYNKDGEPTSAKTALIQKRYSYNGLYSKVVHFDQSNNTAKTIHMSFSSGDYGFQIFSWDKRSECVPIGTSPVSGLYGALRAREAGLLGPDLDRLEFQMKTTFSPNSTTTKSTSRMNLWLGDVHTNWFSDDENGIPPMTIGRNMSYILPFEKRFNQAGAATLQDLIDNVGKGADSICVGGQPGGSVFWGTANTQINWDLSIGNSVNFYVKERTDTVPKIVGVSFPSGDFYPGQTIPVTVEFNTYTDVSMGGVVYINGQMCKVLGKAGGNFGGGITPAERTYTKFATFGYTVSTVDAVQLALTGQNGGFYDSGALLPRDSIQAQAQTDLSYVSSDTNIKSARLADAATQIAFDNTTIAPAGETVNISVTLNNEKSGNTFVYGDSYNSDADDTTNQSHAFKALIDGTAEVPLTYSSDPATGYTLTGSYAFTDATAGQTHTVELLCNGTVVLGAGYDSAPQKQLVQVVSDDLSLSVSEWPSGRDNIVLLMSDTPTVLTYDISGDGTFKSDTSCLSFASSNENVLTVEKNMSGEYYIAPKAEGTATITMIHNNRSSDQNDWAEKTLEVTVEGGGTAAILIPEGTDTVTLRKGEDAVVRWSSNLRDPKSVGAANAEKDVLYTVTLYKTGSTDDDYVARWIGGTGSNTGTTYYVGSLLTNATSFTVPREYLTELSVIGSPGYCVVVSAPNPVKPTETLSAQADLIVRSQPAQVAFTDTPDSQYQISGKTMDFTWEAKDLDPINGYKITLSVLKNGVKMSEAEIDGQMEWEKEQYWGTGQESHTIRFTPAEPSGLNDVYTIMISAKNKEKGDNTASDLTTSTASYVLYVYKKNALQIQINNAPTGSSYTMDNTYKVKNYTAGSEAAAKADVADLRSGVTLRDTLGVNSSTYAWNPLNDKLAWEISKNGTASINYRQGALYSNLDLFDYTSYQPATQFILSGLKDGRANITVEHVRTGMTDTVGVDVVTQTDKFYLFQTAPAIKTTLTYTNGAGRIVSVDTQNDGSLALYDEQGIASDVALRAELGGTLYLGTLYREDIVSGERDSTQLQLYPLNTVRMREAAKAELYLKDENGEPYTGSVILRGGVYKNDFYCETAGMKTTRGGELDVTTPAKGISVTPDTSGKITVYMDHNQFWSAAGGENTSMGGVQNGDRMRFIFELTGAEGYNPQLLYVNGSLNADEVIFSADNVVTMTKTEGAEGKPFIAAQYADYGLSSGTIRSVLRHTGYVGPNSTYQNMKLVTNYLLWGKTTDVAENEKA
jgi:hypothetical protein